MTMFIFELIIDNVTLTAYTQPVTLQMYCIKEEE